MTPGKSLSYTNSLTKCIDDAIFTIGWEAEVVDFLKIFAPELKVPESVQSKSLALQVEKTMIYIINDLGLEMSE